MPTPMLRCTFSITGVCLTLWRQPTGAIALRSTPGLDSILWFALTAGSHRRRLSDIVSCGIPRMETPQHSKPVGALRRLCDVIFGIGTSFLAILVGIFVWGMLFDRTGGEPFSSTTFGAISMWPILLIIIIGGPSAWWLHRTIRRRLIIFGIQVLGTHAAIGLSWLGLSA